LHACVEQHARNHLSPCGRGRIARVMRSINGAIRVRGFALTIDRDPSPQPSPDRSRIYPTSTILDAQLG
jgi:hypothetical protein